MEFFKNVDLSFAQVQCLCRGMHTLASSDGIHPREEALIRDFHDACRPAGGASYEDTVKTAFRLEDAMEQLGKAELRRLFVKTLWLLAFADGKITAPERDLITDWAGKLGLSEPDNRELQAETKEFLLAQLAPRIRNTEALAALSKEMKVL